MDSHRVIILGGGVIAFSVFLFWEAHNRNVASAAASAQQAQGVATAYAVASQTVESTNIPAGGELPIDDEGNGGAALAPLPVSKIPVITPITIPGYGNPNTEAAEQ